RWVRGVGRFGGDGGEGIWFRVLFHFPSSRQRPGERFVAAGEVQRTEKGREFGIVVGDNRGGARNFEEPGALAVGQNSAKQSRPLGFWHLVGAYFVLLATDEQRRQTDEQGGQSKRNHENTFAWRPGPER